MLSTRGRKYADLNLAAGYMKKRGPLYNKLEHPDGLVSLTTAENFLMQERALNFVKTECLPKLELSTLTYHDGPFGSRRLRHAMANFINARFAPFVPVTNDEITFVSGVTALNEILSLCTTEENEGFLLGMPIYGSFAPDLQTKSNCRLVYTSFEDQDQFSVQAVDHYERALQDAEREGIKVRALVLTNPHNPLGQCYPQETLEAILRFCGKYNIHLISDEIYALSVYCTGPSRPGFTSILSIDIRNIVDSHLVHVLYGLSKDFAAAGLRLGCLISKSAQLTQAVRSLARFHCASPLTDAIATTVLEDEDFCTEFLQESQRVLGDHRAIAAEALDDANIPYARNSNAGFFLWIDLSACLQDPSWQAEEDLKMRLYDHGVEMSTGQAYHDRMPGSFRFIFSVDRDTLVEGLARIVSFFKTHSNNVNVLGL
ncbi:aminotransferase, classes I and II family [Dothidotthia symphoricarpi CBS 119687]|uniref:Aminotransferase, classes I and II family n=1 Tax=Dothidotthia symphoricarpi CBS 119687 TaxID=1392245 RepID=A0A6A5ZYL0_9PLEO|nr:aminotransferase, classes I and II family [Dothidotthia symphoricarpi CBS 119687]KAF2124105.1 aminotransferase, classes I and II family [Dothidotthia symphoricarpi CBS 119687]